jgi:hypothetical protein
MQLITTRLLLTVHTNVTPKNDAMLRIFPNQFTVRHKEMQVHNTYSGIIDR